MIAKHTPAPWNFISDKVLGTLVRSEGLIIAKIRELEGIDHEANAKLIAAAPELLEALKQMLSRFNEDECKNTWDKKAVWFAKAAIKKATE